jgi:hypothetical protein
MIRDEHKQFLLGPASAGRTRHSGRMLYDHLAGTHALLESWGASEDICKAGLFHSIYGTRRFRHQSWPLTDRNTIQELIGMHAEALAYLFCTSDRAKFLEDWTARGLREIEAANLIEQGSSSRRLKSLYVSDISDAAKRAIERHLRREVAA